MGSNELSGFAGRKTREVLLTVGKTIGLSERGREANLLIKGNLEPEVGIFEELQHEEHNCQQAVSGGKSRNKRRKQKRAAERQQND